MRLFPDVWCFGDLEPHSFDLIMADDPWRQEMRSQKGEAKSPQAKYRTMTVPELKRLPVLDLAAKDCVLFQWGIHNMVPQTLEVIKARGFTIKTSGVWVKTTKNGKLAFGTGYILRGCSEPYYIATRGNPRFVAKNIRGAFLAPVREHSRKPDKAYEMCERMIPNGRYLEIFSKTDRNGWTSWGDEAGTWQA